MDNERGTLSDKTENRSSIAENAANRERNETGAAPPISDCAKADPPAADSALGISRTELPTENRTANTKKDAKEIGSTESANSDPSVEDISPDLIVPEGETKKQRAKRRLKLSLKLFLCYLKIGLFTFGGGYAMIAFIENEYVRKRRWITNEEFYEIIAIAESTPGPIAINSATFIGYKLAGFFGALVAVIAVCIPSFVIIFIISIFYDEFMAFTPVQYAFEGIKVGIAILITSAGVGMMKKAKKDAFDWCVFVPALLLVTLFDIFNIDFSSIYLILIGIGIGIIYKLIIDIINKKKGGVGLTATAGEPRSKESDCREEDLL